ncbi:MAG: type II secretion system F family protein [Rhizobiales bacterium]|nr:type II secretion system F family protein [Hyphomicrobiales bacterium]
MKTQTLLLFILVSLAMGGVAWVFIYPFLSGERQAERRKASVAKTEPITRSSRGAQRSRRDQVEETLKELEIRNQKKKITIAARISQAGLSWTKRQFVLLSAGLGIGAFLIVMITGMGLLAALGMGFAAGFGLPFWILNYLKSRREKKFLNAFPDAVDVIVRGIKAGLPLLDSMKIIASEAPEPVKSEFKSIIETQTIGLPLSDACVKLYERIPLPEANFFGIVIAIQQKAGGNLSEALGNLSRVLRDRKRMKGKITAMSMEAKASAVIIAALPIAVMTLVYLTSPNYIELLWTEAIGRVMLAACAMWMFIGVMVMRKMINFDF